MAVPLGEKSLEARVANLESLVAERLADLNRRVAGLEQQWKPPSSRASPRDEDEQRLLAEEGKAGTEVEAENADKVIPEYALQRSALAMAFLAGGMTGLDGASEALMILGALVNLVVQLAFCIVLQDKHWVSTSLGNEEWGAWRWRMTFGHAISNADPVTGSSLVSRMCNEDKALQTSSPQEGLHDAIERYFSRDGYMLSICVLTVYTMACCVELRSVINFALGICSLPRGSTALEREGSSWRIKSLSKGRLALGLFIAVLKAVVALVLFRSGILWLAKTVDMEALLLNCVALSFVLEVDEVVYACFSPARLDVLLDALEPLRFPSSVHMRRLLRQIMTGVAFGFLAYAVVMHLWPLWDSLRVIDKNLCGGEQDFVFGVDSLGSLWYTDTTPHNKSSYENSSLITSINENRLKLVARIVELNHTADPEGEELWPETKAISPQRMTGLLKKRVVDYAMKHKCEDGDITTLAYHLAINETDCASLSLNISLCDKEEFAALRLRCPVTCGCSSPISGLRLRDPHSGCPASCAVAHEMNSTLQTLPCKQRSDRELLEAPGWKRWFANRWTPDSTDPVRFDTEKLAEVGCEGMAKFLSQQKNSTERDQHFHICRDGMAAFCPETCGCGGKPSIAKEAVWNILKLMHPRHWGCPLRCASKEVVDIPHAKSCISQSCDIHGQFCPPGLPGSQNATDGYCCDWPRWKKGKESDCQ